MSAGPWQSWPPQGRPGGEGDTGERLRAALSARSAQVGADGVVRAGDAYGPGPADAYGSGPGDGWSDAPYDRTGSTRAEDGGDGYGGDGYGGDGYGGYPGGPYGSYPGGFSGGGYPGSSGGGPSGRAPLFPRWAKLTLAVGLLLSAALGIGLGLHSSSSSTPALPPARETSYGEDRARVAITAFYRQGKVVTLELELTNLAPLGSDNAWSVNNAFSDSGYDLSGIRLIDPASGASYRPAKDGQGDCLCSKTISLTIEPGSSSRVSATFAAPAANVTKLSIDVPGVGSFRDVALSG